MPDPMVGGWSGLAEDLIHVDHVSCLAYILYIKFVSVVGAGAGIPTLSLFVSLI